MSWTPSSGVGRSRLSNGPLPLWNPPGRGRPPQASTGLPGGTWLLVMNSPLTSSAPPLAQQVPAIHPSHLPPPTGGRSHRLGSCDPEARPVLWQTPEALLPRAADAKRFYCFLKPKRFTGVVALRGRRVCVYVIVGTPIPRPRPRSSGGCLRGRRSCLRLLSATPQPCPPRF